MLARLKAAAKRLKGELFALWFAARHPDTPWYAKLLLALLLAYAASPIDLIPDFVPVLGYLDELLLLPLGIWLVLRMIPPEVMAQSRARAAAAPPARRRSLWAGAVIVALWLAALAALALWLLPPG